MLWLWGPVWTLSLSATITKIWMISPPRIISIWVRIVSPLRWTVHTLGILTPLRRIMHTPIYWTWYSMFCWSVGHMSRGCVTKEQTPQTLATCVFPIANWWNIDVISEICLCIFKIPISLTCLVWWIAWHPNYWEFSAILGISILASCSVLSTTGNINCISLRLQ